jgi:cytochrome c-type biogenesis protein CcmE
VPVVYTGTAPIPDTFKEGASVLVEGTAGDDGQFVGKQIQAKCASKYESDPADAYKTGYTVVGEAGSATVAPSVSTTNPPANPPTGN